KNNLKQIGLAIHNYHDTHNCVPILAMNNGGGGLLLAGPPPPPTPPFALGTKTPPLPPQAPLSNQPRPPTTTLPPSLTDPTLLPLAETVLAGFLCPSDSGPRLNDRRPFTQVTPGTNISIARANIIACSGDTTNTGVFGVLNDALNVAAPGFGTVGPQLIRF